jgi:predicted anti-sigma-YlaC factor YlaD
VSVLRTMEKTMTCAEFQETLPELFEAHADLNVQEHLKTCENCAALVRDLEYIAAQAKLLLPMHDPSPAVWDHIQHAIRKGPDGRKAQSAQQPGRK